MSGERGDTATALEIQVERINVRIIGAISWFISMYVSILSYRCPLTGRGLGAQSYNTIRHRCLLPVRAELQHHQTPLPAPSEGRATTPSDTAACSQ